MQPLALVLENDAGTRKLLDILLARIGFQSDVASDGSDALTLLQHVEYDAIFLDLFVPGVSGAEVVAWIARERPHLLSRITVLSSAPPIQLQRLQESWPVIRVMRKPFELGEITAAAQAATEIGPRETRSSATQAFIRHSIRSGAKAGIVVKRDGALVQAVLAFGYAPNVVESFFPVSLDAPVPICLAIRQAKPVWLTSLRTASAEYPELAALFQQNQSRALGAVPIVRNGRIVGAAGWTFREPLLHLEREQQAFASIVEPLSGWWPWDDEEPSGNQAQA